MKSDQWIRKLGLIVFKDDKGLDLSEFHVKFRIEAADVESPNSAFIRIYNLSKETAARIKGEFTKVTLNAGYQTGNYGIIFTGTIRRFREGKESNIDTYFDILAADGDIPYNIGFVNTTLKRGAPYTEQIKVLANAMEGAQADTQNLLIDKQHVPAIRSQVLFGMARARLRNVASSLDASWSIQNGKVVISTLSGYDQNHVVKLNAGTGLIGLPEQTDSGIVMRCLLNSRLRIGGTVEIDNSKVNRILQQDPNAAPIPYNQWTGFQHIAPLSPDGTYRIFVINHEGDTRGQAWYSEIIGLAVDKTAPKAQAVSNQ